jgi:hypothetical protein
MNARRCASRLPRQRGQGTIEFYLVSFWVLIPLFMAILQLGLLVMAKNTLNVATVQAARAGAASGGDREAMKDALALGLTPLFVADARAATGTGSGDVTAGNFAPIMGAALAESKLVNLASTIKVINPTRAAFSDFGVPKNNDVVIPVTNVYDNTAVGAASGETRADALLLKIEVRYCHKMAIPIIDTLVAEFLSNPLLSPSAADLLCYADKRMPIISQAVVRMTTPPRQRALL